MHKALITKYYLLFIGLCVAMLSGIAQIPTEGLAAYYRFDNSTLDEGPNRNDGKIIGNVEVAADRFGNPCSAMHFDGKSYIEVPNSPSLESVKSAFSIAAWFRLDKVADGNMLGIILNKDAQFKAGLVQRFAAGESFIAVSGKTYGQDKNYQKHLLDDEKWHFLVVSYEDNWGYAYLDGELIWQELLKEPLVVNNAAMEIGRELGVSGGYLRGCLDDLRIYSHKLSNNEMTALFKEPVATDKQDVFTMKMPRDIKSATEKGKCTAVVNFAKPRVEISCGSFELKQISGPAAGSAFQVGTTLVMFEVSTPGKSLVDSFHVVVADNEAPAITCPANILLNAQGNEAVANYPEVSLTDNCPNAKLVQLSGYKSGSNFPLGTTTVKYLGSDANGNFAECAFNVTVQNAPVAEKQPEAEKKEEILVPPTEQTKQPEQARPVPVKEEPKPVVKEEPKPITKEEPKPVVKEQPKPVVKEEPKPVVKDETVIVREVTPAANNKPAEEEEPDHKVTFDNSVYHYTDKGKCGAIVTYKTPTLPGAKNLKVVQTGGLGSGSYFKYGSTTNTFESTDAYGNHQEYVFNVTVKDNEAPTVICPKDSTITLPHGRRGITFNYKDPVLKDNCGVDTLIQTEGSKSGCFLPEGMHRFSFQAMDESGNSQVCSFVVSVYASLEGSTPSAPTFINESLNLGGDSINYEHKVETQSCLVTIYMFDDGEEDNDTVSVVYNNQIIVNKEMIRLKENTMIKRYLTLTSGVENYIAAKAWNTGKYGLNTLRIEVYEGYIENDKRDLKGKKPILTKVLHSRPGKAGGLILKCVW